MPCSPRRRSSGGCGTGQAPAVRSPGDAGYAVCPGALSRVVSTTDPMNEATRNRCYVVAAAVIYVITALCSIGFYHPDEHFQIIEFAGLAAGWNSGADLPWEYAAHIRPTMQPMLCLGVFRLLGLAGLTDPYTLATALNVLTALVAVGAITLFVRAFRNDVAPAYREVFVLLSYFLWFLPVLNVRFSSECWAGLAFLSAVAVLYRAQGRPAGRLLLGGVLLGLAFVFRAQIGGAIVGLQMWLVWVRRESLRRMAFVVSGMGLSVLSGLAVDRWFYDEWILTQFNYLKVNLIDGVASQFGTDPWHYYLGEVIARPNPLVGLSILVAFAFLLLYRPRHVVVWCVLPFLLLHSLIGHKEFRFLFPIVNLVPLILVLGYQQIREVFRPRRLRALSVVMVLLLAINAGGLAMVVFKPVREGRVAMARYIDHTYGEQSLTLCSAPDCNPYELQGGPGKRPLVTHFYLNPHIHVDSLGRAFAPPAGHGRLKALVRKGDLADRERLERSGFVEEHQSIPEWIEVLNVFYRVIDDRQIMVLYTRPEA